MRTLIAPSLATALVLRVSVALMSTSQSSGARADPEPVELSVDVRGGPARIALCTLRPIKGASSIFRGCMRVGGEAVDVAVRVFAMTFSDDERAVQSREISALRRLEHPGILPLYGECRLDRNHTAIVMPFVINGNLDDAASDLSHNVKLNILVDVAQALVYLHGTAGLVHGDLKPSNVLLSHFGSALLTGFNFRASATLRYAAPELLLDGDLDASSSSRFPRKTPESDIYAFGCLALSVMSDTPPWGQLHEMAIMRNMAMGASIPRPPEGTVSDHMWELCEICCANLPDERPSAAALTSRLLCVLEGSADTTRDVLRSRGPPARTTKAPGSACADWITNDTVGASRKELRGRESSNLPGGGIHGESPLRETRVVAIRYVVGNLASRSGGTGHVQLRCRPKT